jgi:hypothetical protein
MSILHTLDAPDPRRSAAEREPQRLCGWRQLPGRAPFFDGQQVVESPARAAHVAIGKRGLDCGEGRHVRHQAAIPARFSTILGAHLAAP